MKVVKIKLADKTGYAIQKGWLFKRYFDRYTVNTWQWKKLRIMECCLFDNLATALNVHRLLEARNEKLTVEEVTDLEKLLK